MTKESVPAKTAGSTEAAAHATRALHWARQAAERLQIVESAKTLVMQRDAVLTAINWLGDAQKHAYAAQAEVICAQRLSAVEDQTTPRPDAQLIKACIEMRAAQNRFFRGDRSAIQLARQKELYVDMLLHHLTEGEGNSPMPRMPGEL